MPLESGFIGFAALASLATARNKFHPSPALRRMPSPRTCRVAGWALLALSACVAVLRFGGSLGSVVWIGELCLAGLLLVLLLSWKPDRVWLIAAVAMACGLAIAANSL
jgi:hypothetical protein